MDKKNMICLLDKNHLFNSIHTQNEMELEFYFKPLLNHA